MDVKFASNLAALKTQSQLARCLAELSPPSPQIADRLLRESKIAALVRNPRECGGQEFREICAVLDAMAEAAGCSVPEYSVDCLLG